MEEKEVGNHFISTYYNTLAFQPEEIVKFYDSEATIWRSTMESPIGKKLADANDDLLIKIPTGCEVVVTGYSVLPLNGQILVNTNGFILNDNDTELFSQSFVLVEKSKRYFIIADSFSKNNAQQAVNTTAQTFVAQKVEKPKRQNKPNQYNK
ncbi:hypothetical protein TVAG_278300 [Trichomonas vaginalis G3]|uniref:NTF2 domain-containing protein n=1 Tax=Trichomonas vaginalis (strain ATCC PRA-98 / G3) TaxID=412133 RepID=A2DU71_TRIV3|nr:nuclear transport factor 2 (NTF2) family [Trichomonas vaginalis G3]EAY16064.1 hypothetical protein TVAG_278300 [Trichomonas vaginalis G3]KAI5537270.1 nuclear transport factor 2 (NTF2) family [Trichomonas vaginalis G3]|eukprot:XP_001328287.1 hypothetical protein [Trichomonas vaginalis G3]